ncbi:MAG TPA: vitamin K epoxide reductase family protein [Chitinophaga sp.]|uniref:vitamin K epoxide reductase family protein n=1 Tax=Chitinophaga sp. TaxID=1869181 RepID=UPI002BBC3CBC|nr:vitamin K epoxide reductase family protein [Chitinophaga sp.]HVI46646.1 vitamin K epoxide reductase family protein [Chitinophaga sp.]
MSILANIFNIPEENCVRAVCSFVKLLKVPATEETIKEELTTHPGYPSMLSVSDVLTGLKIRNFSVRARPEQLSEVPVPFIAQVTIDNKEFFTVVSAIGDGYITFTNVVTGKPARGALKAFTDIWTGVALLAEPAESAGERDYAKKRKERGLTAIVTITMLSIVLLLWLLTGAEGFSQVGMTVLFPFLLMTIKLAGVAITLLLLAHEVDAHHPLMEKVCKASATVNCDAVLSSEGAKVAGVFSWSEIGFAYFAGDLLVMLMSGMNPAVTTVLAWSSLLALPYVFFSIYYQWRVVKQWCVLCLVTQALLVLETVTAFSGGLFGVATLQSLSVLMVLKWLLVWLVPFSGWLMIKPYLMLPKEKARYKYALTRFRQNQEIFGTLLAKQRKMVVKTDGLGITLGPADAPHKIIKVCNLYCGPCSETHPFLEDILEMRDDVQVQILFLADTEADRRTIAARHLLSIAETEAPDVLKRALHDWYSAPRKDYEAFALKHPVKEDLERQALKTDQLSAWVRHMNVVSTPTFFYNGYQLPPDYRIEDLRYFLVTGEG